MMKNKPIHFILGMGRSGTTILLSSLNNHSKVHGLPEINFLIFFLDQFRNKKNLSISDVKLVMKQIDTFSLSHPFIGWSFDEKKTFLELELASKNGMLSYLVLCNIIYENIIPNNNAKNDSTFFLDKNPSYPLMVDKIGAFLPDARFIFIVRDYRSNILSLKQSVFIGSPEIAFNAYRWNFFNKRVLNYAKRNVNRVLLVRYEDFITNNEEEMNKICTFLGINSHDFETDNEFISEKINFSDYYFPERFRERFDKKYSDLKKPLNKDRLNSWETQLTPKEIKKCDAICYSLANELGYIPKNKLSKFELFFTRLTTISPFLKAFWHIQKDRILFYFPVKMKLKRLIKNHESIGFTKK